jgi:hypothetical protein
MGSATALIVVLAGAIGITVGRHARTARGATGDLKLQKQRIPALRAARSRSGLWSITLIVLTLLVLRDLTHGPSPAQSPARWPAVSGLTSLSWSRIDPVKS